MEGATLYVDGAILAPLGDETAEVIVENILELHTLVTRWGLKAASGDQLAEDLVLDNRYPYPGPIAHMLREANIDYVDAHDLLSMMYALLDRMMSVDEILDVVDILISGQDYGLIGSADGVGKLDTAWWRLLDLLAVAFQAGSVASRPVLTTPARAKQPEIRVSGVLEDIETGPESLLKDCTLGPYSQSIRTCSLVYSALQEISASETLGISFSGTDILFAIQLRTFQFARSTNPKLTWQEMPKFVVTNTLVESVRKLNFPRIPGMFEKFLRACAEVLLNINEDKSHDLRKSRGGNSPARRSGMATAKRRDIDNEYHLHLWNPTLEGVEFSCVVPHRDMNIPDATGTV